MHRLMMEKVISSMLRIEANQFKNEETLMVHVWNPHYDFPDKTPEEIEKIQWLAGTFAEHINNEFKKVTSEIQTDTEMNSHSFVKGDLYGIWNNKNCANELVSNVRDHHQDIDNIFTGENPTAVVDNMSYLCGGESDKITKLDFFYIIVVRWDKSRVEESVATGYNVNQYIQDSLAGLMDSK